MSFLGNGKPMEARRRVSYAKNRRYSLGTTAYQKNEMRVFQGYLLSALALLCRCFAPFLVLDLYIIFLE